MNDMDLDDVHEGIKWLGDIARLIAGLLGIRKHLEKPKAPPNTEEQTQK